jgi:GDP-L-fucose synthase
MSAPFGERSRVLVAGALTLAGSALLTELRARGFTAVSGEKGTDLRDPAAVDLLFRTLRPEFVFAAAGLSAGIGTNRERPADLMLDNLLVSTHVIAAAARHRVAKLVYLGSSCSYPRDCPQPMRPESLLTGALEPTNEPYAVAKLAGTTLCAALRRQHGHRFVTAIPANPFGPGDDFDERTAHVVPALLVRIDRAMRAGEPRVTVWGTGTAVRDFILAEDLARAAVRVMERYEGEAPINLGTGRGVSIRELAEQARSVVGYRGELAFDATRPNGMPVKVLDTSALEALGNLPSTPLRVALERTYRWYLTARRAESAQPVHA